MTDERRTPEQYRKLLSDIHDEAAAGLATGDSILMKKALSHVVAMARYESDVIVPADKVRPAG